MKKQYWLYGFITIIIIGYVFSLTKNKSKCNKCDKIGLTHPLFNLRELCKQFILLEDHFSNKNKQCSDCIRKHLLFANALIDEAKSLDTNEQYSKQLDTLSEQMYKLQIDYINGLRPQTICANIRKIRKPLVASCFNYI